MKSDYLYLVYDTETTGLNAEKNGVLEIAFCAMNNNLEDVGEYESGVMKIYDNREINAKALECNGITRKQIENGREGKEVVAEIIKYIKSLKKPKTKIILCGQNIISFDNDHLADFFEFHGKDLSNYVNSSHFVDTMVLGRMKHQESTNYKLGTLCENVGVELVDAHRAINDTRATKELVKNYIMCLRNEGQVAAEPEEEYKRPRFQY